MNAFVPRPRWGRGITRGIESWGPLLGLSGPIRKGRLWFGHALEYRFERAPAETAAGAEDRRQNGVLSLTQVDARLSSSHLLTAWVAADLDRIEGFGLNAFMPAGSMPVHRKRIWSGSFLDRLTIGLASTLETRLAVRRHRVLVQPSAAATDPYTIAHDSAQGRYFNSQDRRAHSFHLAAVVTSARTNLAGEHLFKAGFTITRTVFAGTNASQPVLYLRSSGRVARQIQFLGDPSFDARGHEVGLFVQDSWAVRSSLRLEAGLRLEAASFLPAVVTPRVGVTWQVTGRTTVTGGIGLYADRMPLAALAFRALQSRVETVFDEASVPVLPATTSRNAVRGPLERQRSGTWSAEIDQTLGRSWRLRLVYQERLSGRELVVRPVSRDAAAAESVLSSQGSSRARSLEATFGFRPPTATHQLYVSYVRSTARGNLNDLNTIEGLLRQPFVQPDAVSRLGADVPHRLIVWGLISLPGSATFGPFLELRSGFPYSVLGDDWSYAEHPNSRRLPTFASLDIVVTKDLTLPGDIPARIGAKVFNVTGARNGRDVQRDIDRADFGRTFNAVGAQVRGFFEILWGEKRK